MNIDQLPVELLMNIFRFLPTYKEVSLVNKLFYDIACKVNSNLCLRINQKFADRFLRNNVRGRRWLREIQTSKRQISSVEIEGDEKKPFLIGDMLSSATVAVEKFSATIKFLNLSYVTMSVSTFLEILSTIPNVEHLKFYELHCPTDHTRHESLHKRCRRDDLAEKSLIMLKNLKCLSIRSCDEEFLGVFNSLPVGVLSELQLYAVYWKTFMALLSRQLNIKKLQFERIRAEGGYDFQTDDLNRLDEFAMDNFDKLKLESLEINLYSAKTTSIATILSKQTKLKSLNLSDTPVDDEIMNFVTDLADLELLEMNVKETPVASLPKITKLKILKDLTLHCCDAVKWQTFAGSDIPPIDSLNMKGNVFRISLELMQTLGRSVPQLKHLNVSPNHPIESDELNWIMTHFNFVEVLHVNIWRAPLHDCGDYHNLKLREFSYIGDGSYYKPWMTIFTAAYPNLKKLTLDMRCREDDFNPVQIAPILKAFPKLESLVLSSEELFVEDLDCLLNCKHKLKFLSMEYLKTATLPKVMKKVRAIFDVVKVDDYGDTYGRLNMAVDRYVMNRERRMC